MHPRAAERETLQAQFEVAGGPGSGIKGHTTASHAAAVAAHERAIAKHKEAASAHRENAPDALEHSNEAALASNEAEIAHYAPARTNAGFAKMGEPREQRDRSVSLALKYADQAAATSNAYQKVNYSGEDRAKYHDKAAEQHSKATDALKASRKTLRGTSMHPRTAEREALAEQLAQLETAGGPGSGVRGHTTLHAVAQKAHEAAAAAHKKALAEDSVSAKKEAYAASKAAAVATSAASPKSEYSGAANSFANRKNDHARSAEFHDDMAYRHKYLAHPNSGLKHPDAPRTAGGPGSGWTKEGGHVPGAVAGGLHAPVGVVPSETSYQKRQSVPTGKDTKRIADILTKSKGSMSKAHSLARQMADAIKDPQKAKRRGRAADAMGHSSLGTIFHDRHTTLVSRSLQGGEDAARLATREDELRAASNPEGINQYTKGRGPALAADLEKATGGKSRHVVTQLNMGPDHDLRHKASGDHLEKVKGVLQEHGFRVVPRKSGKTVDAYRDVPHAYGVFGVTHHKNGTKHTVGGVVMGNDGKSSRTASAAIQEVEALFSQEERFASNPEGINQYTKGGGSVGTKRISDIRPGDTIHDGIGRPMLHVTGVHNAKASGYKIAEGTAGSHPQSGKGLKPGEMTTYPMGHKTGTIAASFGHPDHPMTKQAERDRLNADNKRFYEQPIRKAQRDASNPEGINQYTGRSQQAHADTDKAKAASAHAFKFPSRDTHGAAAISHEMAAGSHKDAARHAPDDLTKSGHMSLVKFHNRQIVVHDSAANPDPNKPGYPRHATTAEKFDLKKVDIIDEADRLPDTRKKPTGTPATQAAASKAEAASKEAGRNPSLSGHRKAARLHSIAADHHSSIGNANQEAYHRRIAEHHAGVAAGRAASGGLSSDRTRLRAAMMAVAADDEVRTASSLRGASNPEGINQYTGSGGAAAREARIKELDQKIADASRGGNSPSKIKERLKVIKPLVAEQELHRNALDPTRPQAIAASAALVKTEGGGYEVHHGGQKIGEVKSRASIGPMWKAGAWTTGARTMWSASHASAGKLSDSHPTRDAAVHEIAGVHSKTMRGASNPEGINQYSHGNAHKTAADAHTTAAAAHRRAADSHSTKSEGDVHDATSKGYSQEAQAATNAANAATSKTDAVRAGGTLAKVHADSALQQTSHIAAKSDHEKAASYHESQAAHHIGHVRSGPFTIGVGNRPPSAQQLAKLGLKATLARARARSASNPEGINQYSSGRGTFKHDDLVRIHSVPKDHGVIYGGPSAGTSIADRLGKVGDVVRVDRTGRTPSQRTVVVRHPETGTYLGHFHESRLRHASNPEGINQYTKNGGHGSKAVDSSPRTYKNESAVKSAVNQLVKNGHVPADIAREYNSTVDDAFEPDGYKNISESHLLGDVKSFADAAGLEWKSSPAAYGPNSQVAQHEAAAAAHSTAAHAHDAAAADQGNNAAQVAHSMSGKALEATRRTGTTQSMAAANAQTAYNKSADAVTAKTSKASKAAADAHRQAASSHHQSAKDFRGASNPLGINQYTRAGAAHEKAAAAHDKAASANAKMNYGHTSAKRSESAARVSERAMAATLAAAAQTDKVHAANTHFPTIDAAQAANDAVRNANAGRERARNGDDGSLSHDVAASYHREAADHHRSAAKDLHAAAGQNVGASHSVKGAAAAARSASNPEGINQYTKGTAAAQKAFDDAKASHLTPGGLGNGSHVEENSSRHFVHGAVQHLQSLGFVKGGPSGSKGINLYHPAGHSAMVGSSMIGSAHPEKARTVISIWAAKGSHHAS